jgi:hypothetical protein
MIYQHTQCHIRDGGIDTIDMFNCMSTKQSVVKEVAGDAGELYRCFDWQEKG